MRRLLWVLALVLSARQASAQAVLAHPGDQVGWNYEVAKLAGVATFKICDTVSNAPCISGQPAALAHVAAGAVTDPLPPAGFSVFAFPLPGNMPVGPYNLRIQACTLAGVCSEGVLLPFTFALPAPDDVVNVRIIKPSGSLP